MIKLLHLEIHDTCDACPFLSIESEGHCYYCTNPESPGWDKDILEYAIPDTLTIPDWCPLRTYVEGDKF